MSKPLVVFTYAPAGLGHLRVTDALKDGLPSDYDSVVFAPTDPSIEYIHRLTSINVFLRWVMEWIQQGTPQRVFTKFYRKFLKSHPENIFLEFTSLIKSLPNQPTKIIVLATHFGLAYQIGVIKSQLEKELNLEIKLIVQVTDDSPQFIWYVDVADLIFVSSQYVADELQKYGKLTKLKPIKFVISYYPVSPLLSQSLDPNQIQSRIDQYNPQSNTPINIIIPISGAAVGMNYFIKLIDKLHKLSNRYHFHIICRQAPFTDSFIIYIRTQKHVTLYTSENYQNVVDLYENVYQKNIIAAEITKPSEQAFKALLRNDSIGGSFIFFAQPVGRQEYDNLNYLRRNDLLSEFSRGVQLPFGTTNSARFIHNLFTNGTLYNNFSVIRTKQLKEIHPVLDFWQVIKKELSV